MIVRNGVIAQLVEHSFRMREVRGSTPRGSTRFALPFGGPGTPGAWLEARREFPNVAAEQLECSPSCQDGDRGFKSRR